MQATTHFHEINQVISKFYEEDSSTPSLRFKIDREYAVGDQYIKVLLTHTR